MSVPCVCILPENLIPPHLEHADRLLVLLVRVRAIEEGSGARVIPCRDSGTLSQELETLLLHRRPSSLGVVASDDGLTQIARETEGELGGDDVLIVEVRGHAPKLVILDEFRRFQVC